MMIEFTNVVCNYSGCGCCGEGHTFQSSGPYVVEVSNNDKVSIEDHAKIAFDSAFTKVVRFDHRIIQNNF